MARELEHISLTFGTAVYFLVLLLRLFQTACFKHNCEV